MKKMIILLGFLPSLAVWAQSDLPGRFKNKVKARAEQRVDEGMDKAIDKTEEEISKKPKSKNKKNSEEEDTTPGSQPGKKAGEAGNSSDKDLKVYSRYDFVPGDRILFAEDFSQDVLGEFPLKWFTNNRGEVVSLGGQTGQWMRMFPGGHYVSPGLKKLSENYTIEFDLLLHYKSDEGYPFPNVYFKLMELPAGKDAMKDYFFALAGSKEVVLNIGPAMEESSYAYLTSSVNESEQFASAEKKLPRLDRYFSKPVHVAVWVQKQRLRLWINDEKIFDIPQVVPVQSNFNHLAYKVESSIYEEHQIGMYVTNVKIAEGAPDTRNKLLTEGKFSTTGIRFDVNSATIKPESSGVLAEIAKVLSENPSVKVKIIGHTDSDGDATKNLELSKRRAQAVKTALAQNFKIDASRMETDGLGETKPVADNGTGEGKSQNRRVEFIKQ